MKLPEGKAWKPIATAPKDGTPIIVWSPDIDDGEAGKFQTVWDNKKHRWEWEDRMFFCPNISPTHWKHTKDEYQGTMKEEC